MPLSRFAGKRLFCATKDDISVKRGETEMPSEKILTQKQAYVAELKDKIAGSVAGVVVDYKGINVADDTKMRKELREAGVEYAVVKNTMLRLALAGTELENMSSVLEGTTAIAISKEDRIAPARILCKYADAGKDKFNVKIGYIDGQVMDKAEVEAIAKLPGLEGMLSMFAGALTSTLSGLAVAMQAYVDKSSEEPAA